MLTKENSGSLGHLDVFVPFLYNALIMFMSNKLVGLTLVEIAQIL